MKSFRMVSILLCCILLWACNSVLGTDHFKTSTCLEGSTQCTGDLVERCTGGVWTSSETCPHGACNDGACTEDRCVAVDKVDLLIAIDNSRAMADKQKLLEEAIPELVHRLVNPRCVDENGVPTPMQPSGPYAPFEVCPEGTTRELNRVIDMHIGVITSSLGGHGADSCPDIDLALKECLPAPNTTNNDRGHLIDRADQCGQATVPTFMNKHFLAWDPINTYGGEAIVDEGTKGIIPSFRDIIVGAGQIGCEYASQLESIYRFLADPNPYEKIEVIDGKAVASGTDAVLLQQRAEFLRSDSLLAIVMLTDANDCSIKEYGEFYKVGQLRNGVTPVRMVRPRQECATDPHDPCCKSCEQAQGSCPDDPTCQDPNGGMGPALLTETEDNISLRCWDQKRRFGIDFLYPTDRYVQAFSSAKIADRDGNIVANPIFSNLDATNANSPIRHASLVMVAGIVGVPWQDIARDPHDLTKGFKDANEFKATIGETGLTTWDVILGDPAKNVKPLDPLMIETYEKRTGTNPITGDELVDASNPQGNPINGHEWTILNDALQYACIFPILAGYERDCTNTDLPSCDCISKTNDNPLCQADPNNANSMTLQVRAKGLPGLRPLEVLQGLGPRGIVTSICPAQVNDQGAADFGFNPAFGAIIDRMKICLR